MNNEFITSLNEMTDEDLGHESKKKGILAFLSENMRPIFITLCMLVAAGCMIYVLMSTFSYAEAEDIYEDIDSEKRLVLAMTADRASLATPDYAACLNLSEEDINHYRDEDDTNPMFKKMYTKLYFMTQSYPDVYGWITIPGTNINYPIMQAEDNDYYLRRSYSGARLLAGSIFADYRNDRDLLKNRNLILYGHHMTHRLMFHDLDNYLSEEFFNEYNTMYIYTLKGMYTYKIVAAFQTTSDFYYIKTSFTNGDTFAEWANEMIANSAYDAGVTFTSEDRMITLSTCTNLTDNGRLCVEAILTDVYEKDAMEQ